MGQAELRGSPQPLLAALPLPLSQPRGGGCRAPCPGGSSGLGLEAEMQGAHHAVSLSLLGAPSAGLWRWVHHCEARPQWHGWCRTAQNLMFQKVLCGS